jgi:gamma-glutamylcyclotransferase (GGCT)/AIG2-like uncharacterized protein YtfP
MTTHKVFVYGTLKRGHGNNVLILESENSMFLGSGTTNGNYFMTESGVPFAHKDVETIPHAPLAPIRGEVFEVDDSTLFHLDCLEGHPDWYKREVVTIDMDGEYQVDAWVYFNEESHGRLVELNEGGEYEY